MKRIAIVGTGIAGMACAHRLQSNFEITLFEKDKRVGGHTHTVHVREEGREIPIDTGFMVYNETTYPKLTELFRELDVPTQPAPMSFGVQHCESGLEFSGTGLRGLFAQPSQILKPRYWRFLSEISRFNSTCQEVLDRPEYQSLTLQEYLNIKGYHSNFRDHYLIPMSAAVWSSPPDAMLNFPAITLIRFFSNHRFLGMYGQLGWRTVVGGSQTYRDRLIRPFEDRIQVGREVTALRRGLTQIELSCLDQSREHFDAVVIACHADQALQMLVDPTSEEQTTLGAFQYQKNVATLHTDSSLMPKKKAAWAAWNYRVERRGVSTLYWMNELQKVSDRENYFVSINDPGSINPSQIIQTIDYEHPLYTLKTMQAQSQLDQLNQTGAVFFCGSYFRYGFHEDALVSGFNAALAVERKYS